MSAGQSRQRALAAAAGCRPASPVGALLLKRYLAAADTPANSWPPRERWHVYELCRLVEQCNLDVLSIAHLQQTAEAESLTNSARLRRRTLVYRLIRLLQGTGELPPQRDLRHSRATTKILDELPAEARILLRSWKAARHEFVGAYELRHEIRRLALLERIGARYPNAADEYLLDRWLRLQTRQIVDCRCAPLTRAADPLTCNSCGRTAATAGTRPSPGPRKQREIMSIGRRYLDFRRVSRWMEQAA